MKNNKASLQKQLTTAQKTEIGKTPTQDSKSVVQQIIENQKPAVPAALVIPAAFASHDKGLNPEQLRFAIELGAKFPKIVAESDALKGAAVSADEALKRMGERYYGFCNELRNAKLNRRESTLLMKGLGFGKTRISEILKVSEVDQLLWDKYSSGTIGFKATLALGRGNVTEDEGAKGGDGEGGDDEDEPKKKKKKERRLPKEFQPPLILCLEDFGDSLKATGQKDPYVMRWENSEKRVYILTIQPIDAE